MNTAAAVRKVLGRTTRMNSSRSSSSSSSYGVSDHLSMEELPHPARNLTVSRVVIMVISLTLLSFFSHSSRCLVWSLTTK
jgi:hypothetical protein